ncbi:MAG: hypothetical protein KGI19_09915 [Thaumarchaeota archaeon]|nr:hypothetical protein [Nitrososphaerota archaeon]
MKCKNAPDDTTLSKAAVISSCGANSNVMFFPSNFDFLCNILIMKESSAVIAFFPFLGILGGFIVREYYPTFAKGLMYFGLFYGVIDSIWIL